MAKNGKPVSPDKVIDAQDVVDDVNPSPALTKLRKDNAKLRTRVDELKLALGEDEEYFDVIRKSIDAIEPLPLIPYEPPEDKKTIGSALSAVLVLSDWHIGEYVEPDEIEDFNTFNWLIAQRRVHYLCEKLIAWANIQRIAAKIEELVIIVAGDLISGDIHQELQVTNEWPVPVQNVKAAYLLSKAVSQLAPHFKKVRVEFVTADNHARRTKKPQYKQTGFNSEGYVIAFLAKERLRAHKNVEFNVHSKIKTNVPICGFPYLCQHGNTIRGWAGYPWYGVDRQVSREAKARRMMPTKTFYKCIIGHFHTPLKTMDYIVNGSLTGTTELDHGQGRHAPPCQVAFLVHPKYGDFNFNEFYLHFGDEIDFGGAELVHDPEDEDAITEAIH